MQSVASLPVDEARTLLEKLRREGIAADLRITTEESGLETGNIMVEDDHYERACDVADAWQKNLIEESKKKSKRRCPKCRSPHLQRIPHDKLGYVWRCSNCR